MMAIRTPQQDDDLTHQIQGQINDSDDAKSTAFELIDAAIGQLIETADAETAEDVLVAVGAYRRLNLRCVACRD